MMVVALVCACSFEGDSDSDGDVYRDGAAYPGDGDLTLYDGPSAESEDCVIYDLVGTGVQAAGLPGSPTVMVLAGDTITDADGTALCTITTHPSGAAKLSSGGETLYTAVGPWVFTGQISLNMSWAQVRQTYASQLEYTFSGTQIFGGEAAHGYKLATADTHIANASSTRKLVLAAAISAECGGLGLYSEEPY